MVLDRKNQDADVGISKEIQVYFEVPKNLAKYVQQWLKENR